MTTTKPKLSQWPPAVGYIWHQTSKSCCFEECQKISIQPHWSSTWAEQFPEWPALFFFWDSSGPRPANDRFLHELPKINISLNWSGQWPQQNQNCPSDPLLWDTSGTRPQNHAVFKNVKKSISSHIGSRHELNNSQSCPSDNCQGTGMEPDLHVNANKHNPYQ